MQVKTTIGEYEVYIEQTEKVNSRFNRIFLKLKLINSNNIILLGEWRMKDRGYCLEIQNTKFFEIISNSGALRFIKYCQTILDTEFEYYYG
jgi:hypothetical protein